SSGWVYTRAVAESPFAMSAVVVCAELLGHTEPRGCRPMRPGPQCGPSAIATTPGCGVTMASGTTNSTENFSKGCWPYTCQTRCASAKPFGTKSDPGTAWKYPPRSW